MIHHLSRRLPRLALGVEKCPGSQPEPPRVRLVQNRDVWHLEALAIADLHLPPTTEPRLRKVQAKGHSPAIPRSAVVQYVPLLILCQLGHLASNRSRALARTTDARHARVTTALNSGHHALLL